MVTYGLFVAIAFGKEETASTQWSENEVKSFIIKSGSLEVLDFMGGGGGEGKNKKRPLPHPLLVKHIFPIFDSSYLSLVLLVVGFSWLYQPSLLPPLLPSVRNRVKGEGSKSRPI